MAQNIKVNICDKEYSYVAESPEKEQLLRKAAEMVNEKFSGVNSSQSNRSVEDRLSIVAFNIALTLMTAKKKMALLGDEVNKLTELTDKYLNDIEGK